MIQGDTRHKRKLDVLKHIVSIYVSSAAPVSSKAVARSMSNNISSATIRNIMAELEEMQLIEQPYTSAGRIPTDKGYRLYVDHMRNNLYLEKRRLVLLEKQFDVYIENINTLIKKTSQLIYEELNHASMAIWPSMDQSYLKHLELIKLRAETVLGVVVTMTNVVKNYVIEIDKEIDKEELQRISNYINSKYSSMQMMEILDDLKRPADEAGNDISNVVCDAKDIIETIIDDDVHDEVFINGIDRLAGIPEFDRSGVTTNLFKFLTDHKNVFELMKGEMACEGVRAYIGHENKNKELSNCSIVTCGYSLNGRPIGRIGVIGPTRMDYCNVILTVKHLAEFINNKLEEISKH